MLFPVVFAWFSSKVCFIDSCFLLHWLWAGIFSVLVFFQQWVPLNFQRAWLRHTRPPQTQCLKRTKLLLWQVANPSTEQLWFVRWIPPNLLLWVQHSCTVHLSCRTLDKSCSIELRLFPLPEGLGAFQGMSSVGYLSSPTCAGITVRAQLGVERSKATT